MKRMYFLTVIVGVANMLAGCIKINSVWIDKEGNVAIKIKINLWVGGPDRPIGAIVVQNGAVVLNAHASLNGVPVPIDSAVDPDYVALISHKLECAELYDPLTQYLVFHQSQEPLSASDGDAVEFSYVIDPPKDCPQTVTLAGSTQSLLDGCPAPVGCENACADVGIYQRQVDCVPTVSEWALVLMTLVGLVVGTIIFTRRRVGAAPGTG